MPIQRIRLVGNIRIGLTDVNSLTFNLAFVHEQAGARAENFQMLFRHLTAGYEFDWEFRPQNMTKAPGLILPGMPR